MERQMTEHKLIKVKIIELDRYGLLDGSIDSIVADLNNIKECYTDQGFQELEIKTNSYGYDGAFEIYLYGKRLETDREMTNRLKKEEKEMLAYKKADDKKQAEELKLYKKLHKKYGKIHP